MTDRVRVVHGDITRLDVDAIVNAANRTLLGGGAVDGPFAGLPISTRDDRLPTLLATCSKDIATKPRSLTEAEHARQRFGSPRFSRVSL